MKDLDQPIDAQEPSDGETANLMEFDAKKLQEFERQLALEQNLPLACLGGITASLVSAFVWAAVSLLTGYQSALMAVGVGFFVGFAVRVFGKGTSAVFGVVGALMALVGCALGNLLSACGIVAAQESARFLFVVGAVLRDPAHALELMKASFSPLDVIFYVIAVYEGYRFSFRRVSQRQLLRMAKRKSDVEAQ